MIAEEKREERKRKKRGRELKEGLQLKHTKKKEIQKNL